MSELDREDLAAIGLDPGTAASTFDALDALSAVDVFAASEPAAW